jgi:hypothetical protein
VKARVRTLLPIVWLMALLVLPVTAYLVGARQPLLENREKTAFPDLNRGTLRQEHTYQQIDAAIRERLPLRGDAISLRGRIAIELFGDSPTADVVLGKDRWLYYRPELRICEPDGSPAAPPEDAVEILTRTIAASGRKPVVLVAGSKIVTHREHLKGFDAAALACVAATEARVQTRLAETPGGLTVQPKLDALEAEGTPTFLRSDTHWNARGRQVFAEAVLDAVRPGLADQVRLRPLEETERPGDLGVFIGQQRIDRDPMLTVTGTPRTTFAPGEVAFVGDSQFGAAMMTPGADGATVLDRVFPGQTFCHWTQGAADGCVQPMLPARTVVLEIVARNLDMLVDTCRLPVAALSATVRGRAAGWSDDAPAAGRPVSPASAAVRIDVARDRTDVPRLIRIPVAALPTDPAGDPADPPAVTADPAEPRACATTTTPDPAGALVIPVPTGERVADVELRLSGPEGAAVGRPEVLTLDGSPLPARR